MMKLLFCVSLVLLSTSIVCGVEGKKHVSVSNAIDGSMIRVHCFSGDDDLGYHDLEFQQQFSWSFGNNYFGNTKFFCTITTPFGTGSYMVYSVDIMVNRCGNQCNWKVQKTGPCLDQNKGDPPPSPWCLSWK